MSPNALFNVQRYLFSKNQLITCPRHWALGNCQCLKPKQPKQPTATATDLYEGDLFLTAVTAATCFNGRESHLNSCHLQLRISVAIYTVRKYCTYNSSGESHFSRWHYCTATNINFNLLLVTKSGPGEGGRVVMRHVSSFYEMSTHTVPTLI